MSKPYDEELLDSLLRSIFNAEVLYEASNLDEERHLTFLFNQGFISYHKPRFDPGISRGLTPKGEEFYANGGFKAKREQEQLVNQAHEATISQAISASTALAEAKRARHIAVWTAVFTGLSLVIAAIALWLQFTK